MLEKSQQNPEAGARLEATVRRMFRSKGDFAQAIDVEPQNLSRYFAGRLPAGHIMARMAAVLPGQIEYILTGRHPTSLEVASQVPEELRHFLEALEAFTPAQHELLAECFRLVASGDAAWTEHLGSALHLWRRQVRQLGTEMRREDPDPLPDESSA